MPDLPAKLLSTKEVAELLGVSVKTVERMRRRRAITYVKIARRVRFRPEDVQKFITRMCVLADEES